MQNKCEKCIHNDVCKYRERFEKIMSQPDPYIDDIDIIKVDIKCKHYAGIEEKIITGPIITKPFDSPDHVVFEKEDNSYIEKLEGYPCYDCEFKSFDKCASCGKLAEWLNKNNDKEIHLTSNACSDCPFRFVSSTSEPCKNCLHKN